MYTGPRGYAEAEKLKAVKLKGNVVRELQDSVWLPEEVRDTK